MDSQFIFYALIALVIFIMLRKRWKQRGMKNYSPTELSERLKNNSEIILLDVRTKGEHAAQHISGSLHIPLHELAARIGELKKHASREIVCYCQSGSRSASAVLILGKNGFNASNLWGGISEWNFSNMK